MKKIKITINIFYEHLFFHCSQSLIQHFNLILVLQSPGTLSALGWAALIYFSQHLHKVAIIIPIL